MKIKTLICVYTSHDHSKLLPQFYETAIIKTLKSGPEVMIIEVYADPTIASDSLHYDKLMIKTNEDYSNLAAKTYGMISFLVENVQFDHLVKIDVTTLTTALDDAIPTAGKLLDSEKISELLLSEAFYKQSYNGFALHIAKRPGVENWALKKNINIDYQKVFGDEDPPPFYSGKLYLLDRQFSEFIASNGKKTMHLFTQHLPAEDLMIGYLYKQYIEQSTSHDFIQ